MCLKIIKHAHKESVQRGRLNPCLKHSFVLKEFHFNRLHIEYKLLSTLTFLHYKEVGRYLVL